MPLRSTPITDASTLLRAAASYFKKVISYLQDFIWLLHLSSSLHTFHIKLSLHMIALGTLSDPSPSTAKAGYLLFRISYEWINAVTPPKDRMTADELLHAVVSTSQWSCPHEPFHTRVRRLTIAIFIGPPPLHTSTCHAFEMTLASSLTFPLWEIPSQSQCSGCFTTSCK